MRHIPSGLALLVAACMLLAATAPCPPAERPDLRPAGSAPGGHEEHAGHADSRHEATPAPPCHGPQATQFLSRPCSCGCQESGAPQGQGSRLGFALARADDPAPLRAGPAHAPPAAPRAPDWPHRALDPIPI